ncbi:MAG: DUF2723 domain-containing protein [Melioribacter sp.]|nr:DUF2723 domain-containing protein [Melioribacter sp.]
MLVKFDTLKKYYPELIGILVFVLYLFTLAPSVIQIDSGELAAVQSTLGIAHPTGYPLFTLIGFIFLKIPFPFSKIYQANMLAAIWCALSIVFFVKTISIVFDNLSFFSSSTLKSSKKQLSEARSNIRNVVLFVSIFSGFFLAFSKTFWFQSTSVEVYSLQVFLFNLIIYLSIKAYLNNGTVRWVYVGIVLALGFSNHMTTIFIVPLVVILFFDKEKFNKVALKKFLIMLAITFSIILIIYSYLPIRAFTNPEINWGNPNNLENFLRHVSGKQYQLWFFSSFKAAEKQLSYYLKNLPSEFGYVGLIVIIFGIINCYRKCNKIFYLLLITFLFSLFYSINYDIVDIDSYFLLTYIILSFFAAFGIKFFLERLKKVMLSIPIILLIIFVVFVINYPKANQSDVYTFEDYTRAILSSVEPESIILTYQWDYFVSPSYYFQYAENFRRDVAVIDKELLRRSWYYNQIERNYPEIIRNLRTDIDSFLIALKPFERSEEYDPIVLEKFYRKIMMGLFLKNNKNFYIGLELFQNEMQNGELQLPEGYQIVPYNLLFKVVKGIDYIPAPEPTFHIRFPKRRNRYVDFIETVAGTMLTYRAMYEFQYGKVNKAKMYLEKVKKDFKNFRIPRNILRMIEAN